MGRVMLTDLGSSDGSFIRLGEETELRRGTCSSWGSSCSGSRCERGRRATPLASRQLSVTLVSA